MARPLRIERLEGWYHVTSRGNERRDIFRDDREREHFCQLLAEMVARFRVRLHAYVLMNNHYHLLVELREINLSRAVQWLNVSYSVWFNRRHGRSGHLFQGRFKSVAVDPVEWGLALSRYVHLNPVRVRRLGLGKPEQRQQRAGVSSKPKVEVVKERLAVLRQYRWSSYRAYAGLEPKPKWLECGAVLELGGGRKAERAGAYRKYVEQAVREGLESSPWEELKEQVVLGGESFLAQLRAEVHGNEREQGAVRRLGAGRPRLEEVIEQVERVKKESWEAFRDRHGDSGRDLVLYLGRRVCGLKLKDLAEVAGMRDYSAVGLAVKRYEERLQRAGREERKQLERVCKLCNVEM
jgi:REP element-mobilizing transposase RayT